MSTFGDAELVEIVHDRWRTTLAVTVRGPGAHRAGPQVLAEFLALVDGVERAASRFRADSELTGVNAAPGAWVQVSGLLAELLSVAVAAARATDGLVSPCLGRQVDAAGYRSWSASPLVAVPVLDVPQPVDRAAWQAVELVGHDVRIPPGMQLDLGATAKAWLADEVAERIAESTGLDVVANMGGDLRAIAHGQGWVVAVDHEVPGLSARSVEVLDAGLATSGQGRRRWQTPTGPAHHLIDPRTGTSAESRWWAVSAMAASATAANTAATAALLLDGEAAQWLARGGLDGVLTQWSGSGPATQRTEGRWPGQGWAA